MRCTMPVPKAKPAMRLAKSMQRVPLRVVAFKDSSAVPINVSYYSLLGVSKVASKDIVKDAYEMLVKTKLQAAYSADTMFSRAVLLKSAAETLGDRALKRGYDARLAAGQEGLKVSQHDLPGALVLLQEIGEHDAVITLANRWLDDNSRSAPETPDVSVALALAYCDRAGVLLAEVEAGNSAQLVGACEELERASALCRQQDVAHELQEQVAEALAGYAPAYSAALLEQPLDSASAPQRNHGLALLRSVLAQRLPEGEADVVAHVTKVEEMVVCARRAMTAEEQISLYPALTRSPLLTSPSVSHADRRRLQSDALYDTALAYIAAGYVQGFAHYVHHADCLLAQLEALAAAAAARGQSVQTYPVCVERACCAVLLNRPQQAMRVLGMSPNTPYPVEREVSAFVLDRSNTPEDPTPGLAALTQSWLREVALPGFREWSGAGRVDGATASLTPWFKQPRVRPYLAVYSVLRWGPLLEFVHLMCTLGARLAAIFTRTHVPTAPTPQPPASSKSLARTHSTATRPTPAAQLGAPSAMEQERGTASASVRAAATSQLAGATPATAALVHDVLGTQPEGNEGEGGAEEGAHSLDEHVYTTDATPAHTTVAADSIEGHVAGAARRVVGSGGEEGGVPEQPILHMAELMQQPGLTVQQLKERLPKGLLPEHQERRGDGGGGALSQQDLRAQLAAMEKDMWDASSDAAAGSSAGGALSSTGARYLAALLAVTAIAAATLRTWLPHAHALGATLLTHTSGAHPVATVVPAAATSKDAKGVKAHEL